MSSTEFVTVRLAGQLLGIPVLLVQDALKPQRITRVPRAPSWVAGVLNLRGRIVTAIDLRSRLGLPPREAGSRQMSVVIDHDGEPYSLLIDSVGDVLALDDALLDRNPVTMDRHWRDVALGVYRLEEELLILLDVRRLLEMDIPQAA